MAIWVHNLGSH